MRQTIPFSTGWAFHHGHDARLLTEFDAGETVHLPHTAVETPFSHFDDRIYQKPFTYQRRLTVDPAWAGHEISLRLDAAMADAHVYLNGMLITAHKDGYTPVHARLTPHLKPGDNLITVRIDGSENPAIPPFGHLIDYLTYAGLYREAWLELRGSIQIDSLKVETRDVLTDHPAARVLVHMTDCGGGGITGTLTGEIHDAAGRLVGRTEAAAGVDAILDFAPLSRISLWDIDQPHLYTMTVSWRGAAGEDSQSTRFGFRQAEFTPDGFFLNGRHVKIRGLNRHQSFPYVGYALGRAAQERDADILKHELHCNLVRTSHYPQSPWFLDQCDRIGLLVFEEIPGWQHIGDAAWQAEAVENVRRMIRRDWNHPSIILWGVRINESQDDHDFYAETNRVARALDPSRQTGGVRYITDSELLEDVYTMNDFVQGSDEMPGANHPRIALRDQQTVTGLTRNVPYLVTEYNGHMYPTKVYDQEQRQHEHVHRHLAILNAAHADPHIAGCIGWCMFDYNTHKDFGSGDRICHHGVMDQFREPKFAAYAYASQCSPEEEVILKPVTVWARGDRNIGGVIPLIVLTNCDEVEFRFGDVVKRIGPDRQTYPHLPHPPVVIDTRHLTLDELGEWGRLWRDGEFIGYVDGKERARLKVTADPQPTTLDVVSDRSSLRAEAGDCTRVMIRVLDQLGNKVAYLFDPVTIRVTGPARRIGPETISLMGGAVGFWLEATGVAGEIKVTVSCDRLGSQSLTLTAGNG